MSLAKSDEDILFHSTSVSSQFSDEYSHNRCGCSNLISEVQQRVAKIVSTLKQERQEFIDAAGKQLEDEKEDKRKSIEEKDQIIEQLKSQIFKLIAIKNQMKRTFDSTIQTKDQEIKLLKEYVQRDSRKVQSYKLLSPRTKDSSFRKFSSKQIYSPRDSYQLDGDGKFSNSPTSPSITSASRKSSIPKYTPLKGLLSPKYVARSQNIKSALNLISRVNNIKLKTRFY